VCINTNLYTRTHAHTWTHTGVLKFYLSSSGLLSGGGGHARRVRPLSDYLDPARTRNRANSQGGRGVKEGMGGRGGGEEMRDLGLNSVAQLPEWLGNGHQGELGSLHDGARAGGLLEEEEEEDICSMFLLPLEPEVERPGAGGGGGVLEGGRSDFRVYANSLAQQV
jgi:hypothetical protein